MEQRGEPAVALAPLSDLRSLVERGGPFLSVYLALDPPAENLAEATRLRWEALADDAAAQGAPPDLLDAVDAAITGAHRQGRGVCVLTPGDGEPQIHHMVDPPPQPIAAWEAVPVLAPLIADRQWIQPHVVALADRQGVELTAFAGERDGPLQSTTVQGHTHPIRKVHPGGWSQRRFQQRAEETWQHNMSLAAEEVAVQVDRSHARILAIGGDERAANLLRDALPADVLELIRPIAATRASDGSAAQLDDQVEDALKDWTSEQLARTLDLYQEELGQHDRATVSAGDTLAALRSSRAALLLVHDDHREERQAWLGDSPDQIATQPDELPGATETRPVPLPHAAVAAALATGADVQVLRELDGGLSDGIGALLRW